MKKVVEQKEDRKKRIRLRRLDNEIAFLRVCLCVACCVALRACLRMFGRVLVLVFACCVRA